MNPWNRTNGTDEELFYLWDLITPVDFYFAIEYNKDINSLVVYITPNEYFEDSGSMYPNSMPIINLIPDYLTEIDANIYKISTEKNLLAVKEDMKKIGFVFNRNFQDFVDNTNHRSPH